MSFSVDRIRHLYDFQSHYLDLEGHRYHYLDEGQGDPVVMLHGNPAWSFMYRKLIRSLSDTHRVIVPDHMGCGLSDKPSVSEYDYTLRQRGLDLEKLLDHLEVTSNLTLIVHDWGGAIGMHLASWHPERMARLVVLNTAAFLLPESKCLHWSLRVCRRSRVAAFLILRFNAFARSLFRRHAFLQSLCLHLFPYHRLLCPDLLLFAAVCTPEPSAPSCRNRSKRGRRA